MFFFNKNNNVSFLCYVASKETTNNNNNDYLFILGNPHWLSLSLCVKNWELSGGTMASHSLSLPAARIPSSNRLIQKLDSKVLLLWPSRSHNKPSRRASSSIRAMGSSASSHSQQANSTEFESGIQITEFCSPQFLSLFCWNQLFGSA